MKTTTPRTLARLAGITMALALMVGSAGLANAQDKGATQLLQLNASLIEPKSAPAAAKTMGCAACKDEFIARVDLMARGAVKPVVMAPRHLCPTCSTELSVTGHGRAKIMATVHKCAKCGV